MRLAALTLALLLALPTAALAEERRVFTLLGGRQLPADGAPATSVSVGPVDIAVVADGSVLVLDTSALYRIDPAGRIGRVAGGPTQASTGDGGPARDASLVAASDIALMRDGSILIAENGSCGVRRISQGGLITRVAGRVAPGTAPTCLPPPSDPADVGDGGPATDALLSSVTGVAATADGGFLVAGDGRIRRVGPDGTIDTVAGGAVQPTQPLSAYYGGSARGAPLSTVSAVAGMADGGFVFSGYSGVHRVGPDGILTPVHPVSDVNREFSELHLTEDGVRFGLGVGQAGRLGPLTVFGEDPLALTLTARVPGYFDGDGDLLEKASLELPGGSEALDVEVTPGGEVLVLLPGAVRMIAPTPSTRLAVAVARESLPLLAGRRLAIRTTLPARLRIELGRRARPEAVVTADAQAGLTKVRLPRKVPWGIHLVRVRATSATGAVATNAYHVLVGRHLPERLARAAQAGLYYAEYARAADTYTDADVRRCHRFSVRRIDCVVGETGSEDSPPCLWVGATTLRANGVVYVRRYACRSWRSGKIKRNPHWRGPARQAPPLPRIVG